MTTFEERVKAALAGQYDIEREIGAGGMATVFLALDVKHDREVAVKVVQPDIAAALGDERFLREIQITAKLQHPHILPLYDSGEADGLLYYVMPYVPGESLAQRIHREQQLSIPEALQIARETAEALSYAHSYGLVHRDIKPDNILLSRGHAVVADFGIARAISAAGGEGLTKTGMAVGTAAYMSPEQAGGDPRLDERTDIYALGCVLYEMLVGQVPFTGPTAQAVMARHSMDTIPPPHIMRQSIPQDLEGIIYCAMAKTPADRFRTAQEFADAIGTLISGASPQVRASSMESVRFSGMQTAPGTMTVPSRPGPLRRWLPAGIALAAVAVGLGGWQLLKSDGAGGVREGMLDPRNIAVLYFDDLSSDGSLGYIADGVTETLIDNLAAVRSLDVISRNGVAPLRGTGIARDSIATLLETGTLITGAVEHASGDRVRITVQLVDGEADTEFQRESFVLASTDLLAAQDSVGESIARLLRSWLGDEIRVRERRAGTEEVGAWAAVQRAEKRRKNAEALARDDDLTGAFAEFMAADSLLRQAESIDDAWTEPIALRGEIAYRLGRLSTDEPAEAIERLNEARNLANRALAIDPNYAPAVELRGTARYFRYFLPPPLDGDEATQLLSDAQRDLERAVELDPTRASAYNTLSHLYYYSTEDVSAALLAARRAYEEDAYLDLADAIIDRLYRGSYDLAQFAQAQRWCHEGSERFPEDARFVQCHLWMMTTEGTPADPDSAWKLVARLDSLAPAASRDFIHHLSLLVTGGILGRAGFADSAFRIIHQGRAGTDIDPEQELVGYEAVIRALIGDTDTALVLLRRYVAANPGHSFEVGGDLHWWYRNLLGLPGFQTLLSRTR